MTDGFKPLCFGPQGASFEFNRGIADSKTVTAAMSRCPRRTVRTAGGVGVLWLALAKLQLPGDVLREATPAQDQIRVEHRPSFHKGLRDECVRHRRDRSHRFFQRL